MKHLWFLFLLFLFTATSCTSNSVLYKYDVDMRDLEIYYGGNPYALSNLFNEMQRNLRVYDNMLMIEQPVITTFYSICEKHNLNHEIHGYIGLTRAVAGTQEKTTIRVFLFQ